jgi:SOS-response transcriptional repressor LexA
MNTVGVTALQARALQAIKELTVEGVPPSYAELVDAIGLSSKGHLVGILHRLRERGLVAWDHNKARSLRIVGEAERLETRSDEELEAIIAQAQRILRSRAS